jgi:hypothetical protein
MANKFGKWCVILGCNLMFNCKAVQLVKLNGKLWAEGFGQMSSLLGAKSSVKLTIGVDFIYILHSRFLFESKLSSFSLVTFGFVIFWHKNISTKCALKMLMKLTLVAGFIHIFLEKKMRSFFGTQHLANGAQVWQTARNFEKFLFTNLAKWRSGKFCQSFMAECC